MSKHSLVAVERGEKVVTETFPLSDDTSLNHAANVLRQIIDDYISQADDLPWPPTVESLKARLASTPKLPLHFFKVLLTESHHTTSESISPLAESIVQDLLFAITKGKFLTLKHTCIGLGLHNMTGKKLPIVILSHFGQSITYHAVREIETAHAELAEHFTNEGLSLPLQPEFSFSQVPIIFWWDNFDRLVDNLTGGGSIHNTPGIAFQEEVDGSVRRQDVSIVPSKRTVSFQETQPTKKPKINPKKAPTQFNTEASMVSSNSDTIHNRLLCLWKVFRKAMENDQLFPSFPGYVIQRFQTQDLKATTITYLLPIETPINDYGTLLEMFFRSEKLAAQSNMKYGLWCCY